MVTCAFCWRTYSNASRSPRRREALLGAGDVEPDHAHVAVADGQLGDLPRPRRVAHRGQEAADADAAAGRGGRRRPLPKALEYRLDHRIQPEPALDVQLWCEADLGVHDAVRSQVLRALRCDPDEHVPGLHHPDGVAERLQVALQGARVRSEEPGGELGRVAGTGGRVADGVRQSTTVAGRNPPSR